MTSTHAIIIGGSVAGLTAARTLSDHFDRVTLIERDTFPEEIAPRPGVPQSRQPHVLLLRGMNILNDLFPGFLDELIAAGAVKIEIGYRADFIGRDGRRLPSIRTGLYTASCTRPFLEWHLRQRVKQIPNLTIIENHVVTDLIAAPDKARITGVRAEAKKTHETVELSADLIVDASGRGSGVVEWLKTLGYDAPSETYMTAHWGYAARLYQIPETFSRKWETFGLQNPKIPGVPFHGGGIFTVEGDRWIVILSGSGKNYPPTDPEAYDAFIQKIPSPDFWENVKDAQPLSPIYGYRNLDNRRRHFEKLDRLPEHFVVVGDAACGFNPIYGQGMTVAAMEAEALAKLIGTYADKHQFAGLAKRWAKEQAKLLTQPWAITLGADATHIESQPKTNFAARLSARYLTEFNSAMQEDPVVMRTFLMILHLVAPLTDMMKPGIIVRVLRHAWKYRSQSTERVNPAPETAAV